MTLYIEDDELVKLDDSSPVDIHKHLQNVEKKLDEVLDFINTLKTGVGNAQNSGGPMAMMARAMLPDFTQG